MGERSRYASPVGREYIVARLSELAFRARANPGVKISKKANRSVDVHQKIPYYKTPKAPSATDAARRHSITNAGLAGLERRIYRPGHGKRDNDYYVSADEGKAHLAIERDREVSRYVDLHIGEKQGARKRCRLREARKGARIQKGKKGKSTQQREKKV